MHRFEFDDKRVKPDAIIGLVLGVLVAYTLQCQIGFGGGCVSETLSIPGVLRVVIVAAVGGAWYKFRNVL